MVELKPSQFKLVSKEGFPIAEKFLEAFSDIRVRYVDLISKKVKWTNSENSVVFEIRCEKPKVIESIIDQFGELKPDFIDHMYTFGDDHFVYCLTWSS